MTPEALIALAFVVYVTVIVWRQLKGGLFDLYEIVPGFVLSLLAIAGASSFGKHREQRRRRR